MKLDKTAIVAGIIAFIAVYALGGIIIIFVLSLFSEQLSSNSLMAVLRAGGYLALALPAYVAASAARDQAFMQAFYMGLIEGMAVVLLMTFTFSFEGTLHDYVLSRMLPVFGAVLALCMFAGVVAEWVRRRSRTS